jgi:hypothetical protein
VVLAQSCRRCGSQFTLKTPWQVFCGEDCSYRARIESGRAAAATASFRKRNLETVRARHRKQQRMWRSTQHGKRQKKNLSLKTLYGITIEQFEEMARKQNGQCATCLRALDMGFHTHVDHCHKTKAIRGLLCSRCNTALGNFELSST